MEFLQLKAQGRAKINPLFTSIPSNITDTILIFTTSLLNNLRNCLYNFHIQLYSFNLIKAIAVHKFVTKLSNSK